MMQIDPELFYNSQKLAKGGGGVGWGGVGTILYHLDYNSFFWSLLEQEKTEEMQRSQQPSSHCSKPPARTTRS